MTLKSKLLSAITACMLIASQVQAADSLVIGLGNFQPMFPKPNEKALFHDIILGVYEYLPEKDVHYSYMMSNSRLLTELNSGKIDGAANVFIQSEIEGCITDPVFRYEDVVVSHRDDKLNIQSIQDLQGLSVVSYQRARALLGDAFEQVVDANEFYVEVSQPKEQARLLSLGMVDVSVGDKYIFLHSLSSWTGGDRDPANYKFHHVFPPVYTYMGFNQKQDCEDFNRALKMFKNSGQYEQVYQRYLQDLGYHAPEKQIARH